MALFGGLTLASGIVWYLTGSEFWGGICGNMLVGAVTLVFIDFLLDASLEHQRKPATKAAIKAASEVHGDATRLIFNLYGASVLTGRLTLAEHQGFAKDCLDEGMVAVLARTPLRDIAFVSPEKPAIGKPAMVCAYKTWFGKFFALGMNLRNRGHAGFKIRRARFALTATGWGLFT